MTPRAEMAIDFLTRFFASDAHLSEQDQASAQAVVDAPIRAVQQQLQFDEDGGRDERRH